MSAPVILCGKPMRRVEKPGRPVLEDPACGRRENHRGPCRSEAALARIRRYESERQPVATQRRRVRLRTLRLHEDLSAAIAVAEQVARTRALGLSPLRDARQERSAA